MLLNTRLPFNPTLRVLSYNTVFFVGKKNGKKRMVQNNRYLNE